MRGDILPVRGHMNATRIIVELRNRELGIAGEFLQQRIHTVNRDLLPGRGNDSEIVECLNDAGDSVHVCFDLRQLIRVALPRDTRLRERVQLSGILL